MLSVCIENVYTVLYQCLFVDYNKLEMEMVFFCCNVYYWKRKRVVIGLFTNCCDLLSETGWWRGRDAIVTWRIVLWIYIFFYVVALIKNYDFFGDFNPIVYRVIFSMQLSKASKLYKKLLYTLLASKSHISVIVIMSRYLCLTAVKSLLIFCKQTYTKVRNIIFILLDFFRCIIYIVKYI